MALDCSHGYGTHNDGSKQIFGICNIFPHDPSSPAKSYKYLCDASAVLYQKMYSTLDCTGAEFSSTPVNTGQTSEWSAIQCTSTANECDFVVTQRWPQGNNANCGDYNDANIDTQQLMTMVYDSFGPLAIGQCVADQGSYTKYTLRSCDPSHNGAIIDAQFYSDPACTNPVHTMAIATAAHGNVQSDNMGVCSQIVGCTANYAQQVQAAPPANPNPQGPIPPVPAPIPNSNSNGNAPLDCWVSSEPIATDSMHCNVGEYCYFYIIYKDSGNSIVRGCAPANQCLNAYNQGGCEDHNKIGFQEWDGKYCCCDSDICNQYEDLTHANAQNGGGQGTIQVGGIDVKVDNKGNAPSLKCVQVIFGIVISIIATIVV